MLASIVATLKASACIPCRAAVSFGDPPVSPALPAFQNVIDANRGKSFKWLIKRYTEYTGAASRFRHCDRTVKLCQNLTVIPNYSCHYSYCHCVGSFRCCSPTPSDQNCPRTRARTVIAWQWIAAIWSHRARMFLAHSRNWLIHFGAPAHCNWPGSSRRPCKNTQGNSLMEYIELNGSEHSVTGDG